MDQSAQEPLPSTCSDEASLCVYREPINSTKKLQKKKRVKSPPGGKWLIFRETGKPVDEAWKIVKQATKDGLLGHFSNVSTISEENNLDKHKRRNGKLDHVIRVFTYDCTDEVHVFRVRRALNDLGFTEELAYKSDSASRANLFSFNRHHVSLWRK